MKKIIFTGGGSAGHVSVNVALIPEFQKNFFETKYIGSKNGIEKEMISKIANTEYYSISSGKLRRYFDWENFIDPFKVIKGIVDSLLILKKEKPDLVFSKGGFVSVPVCIAAKLLSIPTILHESDLSPGLANKINIKFSNHIFTTFEDTLNHLPANKASLIGAVVRDEIYSGNETKAYELTGFTRDKQVILVMGGSLGSKLINEFIWNNIDELSSKFQIVHITGKGQMNKDIQNISYVQYEFINEELFDIFKITDFTISRAGSNSIYEFLALDIPSILIPLGTNQSRGDQLENAKYFESKGFSKVILEEKINELSVAYLDSFSSNLPLYVDSMKSYKKEKKVINSSEDFYKKILKVIEEK
ncbi:MULTISPECIES: undecaprenyldiphospho-muramoylpentapeptide beta-N-acetylglucosaminyltransferase [unclassified Gemella]|uniref:undecaprenyldiphospho-muramoylpentapeptide beta-N-acetylglucosaminyltransferase n=1 Tax=unclassified Gemella TaxID=2624949 RepID=UPI0015CFC54E|nr:undecaprenyldiphospho-muramoylpentapeptide beta-N-acetylglucosaminyltransferase [Gemella sp. GL1.1]NYS27625.1 undecaprenyldiphospho-muramoylpentapeptide beta-N-acetylglucosaminyltransferase [Gemella sp. GL1]